MKTTCCVVGGGPAGVVSALLLARQGVPVTLLEMHRNFEREFRGDTVHPATMEMLDEIGLADRVLALPHAKISTLSFISSSQKRYIFADLRRLRTKFPYVTLMPQAVLLDFLVAEAKKYSCFQVIMGANVQELIQQNGVTCGVRYSDADGNRQDLEALLTIGCDGRFSKIRKLAGIEPVKTAPPMDVIWMRLPRIATEGTAGGELYFGSGDFGVVLDRGDHWQVGYVIPKGGYQKLRAAGVESLKQAVARVVPPLAGAVAQLKDWNEVTLLSVESSLAPEWHRPGLLLIGDAAHVMSPIAGVGINYAVQDAIAASNLLGEKLLQGRLEREDLAAVQRRREGPVRRIQKIQGIAQRRIVSEALTNTGKPFELPLLIRLVQRIPMATAIPARVVAFGFGQEHVKGKAREAAAG